MKTAYIFENGTAGGFVPAENCKETYMLVCPKSGAHLVKKTEKMRIFTPEQNIDADAYKFDYRIYYDVFVKKSGLDAIWAWVSPEISITALSEDITTAVGEIDDTISVTASSEGELTYQWYRCENKSKSSAVKISGANSASYAIDTDLEAGDYFYFAKVTVDGIASTETSVIKVPVA